MVRHKRSDKRSLTISDAALALKLPYGRVYDLALSGQLRARRVGAGWLLRASDVERLARERRGREQALAVR